MSQQSLKLGFAPPQMKSIATATHLIDSPYLHFTKPTPKPSKAFDTYWKFAHLRQNIFYEKLRHPGEASWTTDPVLRRHRFTNAYRASDRVSQYLIKNVQYNENWSFEDTVFRTLLFKIFNKIDTWELLSNTVGVLSWRKGILTEIGAVLDKAFNTGSRLYSAAYIMPSSKSTFGHERKHRNHLNLIDAVMNTAFLDSLRGSNSLENVFLKLKTLPGIGPFLAYQYSIDLNYSRHLEFSENDFVQAGPGALDGIKKCFSDVGEFSSNDIIKMMVDIQEKAFEALELPFENLWGRPLHLIDCQNLFCETDKYCRVIHPELTPENGRSRIKQIYRTDPSTYEFFFPPKWGLNEKFIHPNN